MVIFFAYETRGTWPHDPSSFPHKSKKKEPIPFLLMALTLALTSISRREEVPPQFLVN